MSSGKILYKYKEMLGSSNDVYLGYQSNISKAVIPFSKIFKSPKPVDIYSGNESIPFKERDPNFKLILRHEFSDLIM
ncbi:hypothetical protein LCGC14_0614410 [marine sediment metagenome]|uniref:Uncharacterized protein n=1 Tax=marine sediment metagenome TaxID=412755 RepID=A0A0F9UFA9_9ZZZZ